MFPCLRSRVTQAILKYRSQYEMRNVQWSAISPSFGTGRRGESSLSHPKDASGVVGNPKVQTSSKESSLRDLVNFPRRVRRERTPAAVFGFIPKTWFDFFYSKTGVTGGYMFLIGVCTYLFSKEIIVCDSEFVEVPGYMFVMFVLTRYVPEIRSFIAAAQDKSIEELDSAQERLKKNLRDEMKTMDKMLWQAEGIITFLSEARRENIHLQMEAAYRAWLQQVYLAVKKNLDYHAEVSNIRLKYTKSNLAYWILGEVSKSITPELKKIALNKAIEDLKLLSTR